MFGTWTQAEWHWWDAADGKNLSKRSRSKLDQLRAKDASEFQAHRKELLRASARAAHDLWRSAKKDTSGHEYLKLKQIKPLRIRRAGDTLLIPLHDADGKLCTLERIVPQRETKGKVVYGKYLLRGARLLNAHLLLGPPPQWRVVIAEGYATAATIHQVTGLSAVYTGGRRHLLPVAQSFRSRYPMLDIVLAADDDEAKAQEKGIPNPGLVAARTAAMAVGGRIAIPMFGDRPPSKRRTDFNDMMRCEGGVAVRKAIRDAAVATPDDGFAVRSLDGRSFSKLQVEPRELLMAPWLPSRGGVMIHGSREVGKTHFEIAVLRALSMGQDFLCWKVKRPVSCLLVDGEMHQWDLQQRILAAFGSRKGKAPWRVITPDLQPYGVPDLSCQQWRDAVEREAAGCEVIILDSISTLLRGPEHVNDAASWTAAREWTQKLKSKGHTVVWIHHDGKNGQQIGTVTREFTLDTTIHLTRTKRLSNGIGLKVSFTKARSFFGGDVAPVYATFETDEKGKQVWGWSRKGDAGATKAPGREKLAARVLELHKEGKKVAEISKDTGVPATTVKRWITDDQT
jgi:putative DNA primase/helicase